MFLLGFFFPFLTYLLVSLRFRFYLMYSSWLKKNKKTMKAFGKRRAAPKKTWKVIGPTLCLSHSKVDQSDVLLPLRPDATTLWCLNKLFKTSFHQEKLSEMWKKPSSSDKTVLISVAADIFTVASS